MVRRGARPARLGRAGDRPAPRCGHHRALVWSWKAIMNHLQAAPPPLVVDLDGTLVNSDLLIESFFVLARSSPHGLLRVPAWLRAGKATLKAEIARRADLEVADLPYNTALVDFLREQKAGGRTLILATAANEKYARQVAAHLGLFDTVLASDDDTNLGGQEKLDALRRHLDGGAFDYAADHRS